MRINFSLVFSVLELFFLSTLARWVKCKLFNSLSNLPVFLAKKNNSDQMLGHNLEYLRNYKAELRLKIVVFFNPLLVMLL